MSDRPLVLVADDDPDILVLVRVQLERAGFDVVVAADGEEALQVARDRSPRLAIVDGSMPAIDGFDVVRTLRADPATAGIRLVLLTARAQEHDVVRGFEAGADAYVKKPFGGAELVARVSELLA
jgi:DNA-binding response OmpR family regulator